MKKTLLALAVLAAAGSVNAAQIYSGDNTSVGLKGEIDTYLAQSETTLDGVKNKQSADFSLWGKIQMDASHSFDNGLTTFASFEVEADAHDTFAADDLYVGVKSDVWGVAVGETGDFAESFDAIQKTDIANEGNYIGLDRPYESSQDGLALKLTPADGLTFVADVYTNATDGLDNSYGVSANYAMDVFSIGASYVTSEVSEGYDADSYGVSASVDVAGFYFAATYLKTEGLSSIGAVDEDYLELDTFALEGDVLNFAASYSFDAVRIYSQYAMADFDTAVNKTTLAKETGLKGEVTDWVFGVDYAIADDIKVFAEYETAKTGKDFDGADYKEYQVGMYYTF